MRFRTLHHKQVAIRIGCWPVFKRGTDGDAAASDADGSAIGRPLGRATSSFVDTGADTQRAPRQGRNSPVSRSLALRVFRKENHVYHGLAVALCLIAALAMIAGAIRSLFTNMHATSGFGQAVQ